MQSIGSPPTPSQEVFRMFKRKHEAEPGQILVIVAVGLMAMIAMVGLVIDGGHAWGQQRDTQNGNDAASEAGALKLSENLPFVAAGEAAPNTNGDVAAAIEAVAAANDVFVDEAWYTDFDGNRIAGPPLIGPGSLAAGLLPPANADGVEVVAFKDFDTFLGQIVGIHNMTARTTATAVAGYVDNPGRSNVLPVVFPLNITTCTNTNRPSTTGELWPLNVDQVVPLCHSDPGNVGWLDWTPPAGGTSELVDSINNPNNPPIHTPGWYFVSQTGNVSAAQVETALMQYAPGDGVVFIPLFDATCQDEPPSSGADACTTGPGTGQNQWYHLAGWVAFDLEWVDLNGGFSVCGSGNGSTGCMGGQFRSYHGIPSGSLRAPTDNENPLFLVGIQLIN
jgi:hypothetical protein